MRSLSRAIRNPEAGGAPLPTVFPVLDGWRAQFRRAELTMVAGEPGAGKSTIALWCAVKWVTRHSLIGLYLSADSSELVAASRAAAMLSGVPVHQVERQIENLEPGVLEALGQLSGLEFSFEPDIALDTIQLELDAFEEKWGRLPDFLVVDNVTDVEGQVENEWTALRNVMKVLAYVARTAGPATIALHHTSEGEKADPCPPRRAIHGKVSQKPAVILTVAGWPDAIKVAVVKNRFGPSDKSGRDALTLPIDHESMRFKIL